MELGCEERDTASAVMITLVARRRARDAMGSMVVISATPRPFGRDAGLGLTPTNFDVVRFRYYDGLSL